MYVLLCIYHFLITCLKEVYYSILLLWVIISAEEESDCLLERKERRFFIPCNKLLYKCSVSCLLDDPMILPIIMMIVIISCLVFFSCFASNFHTKMTSTIMITNLIWLECYVYQMRWVCGGGRTFFLGRNEIRVVGRARVDCCWACMCVMWCLIQCQFSDWLDQFCFALVFNLLSCFVLLWLNQLVR